MNKYQIINHATKKKIIVEANSAQEAATKVGCRIKEVSPIDIGQPKLSGMKLEKAIEILRKWREVGSVADEVTLARAELLGIEALKREKLVRLSSRTHRVKLLPGETKE